MCFDSFSVVNLLFFLSVGLGKTIETKKIPEILSIFKYSSLISTTFLVGAFYQNERDYYSGKFFFLFFSSDHRMYA